MADLVDKDRLVVFITHDIDLEADHADLIVLDGGEIAADGPPMAVLGSQ